VSTRGRRSALILKHRGRQKLLVSVTATSVGIVLSGAPAPVDRHFTPRTTASVDNAVEGLGILVGPSVVPSPSPAHILSTACVQRRLMLSADAAVWEADGVQLVGTPSSTCVSSAQHCSAVHGATNKNSNVTGLDSTRFPVREHDPVSVPRAGAKQPVGRAFTRSDDVRSDAVDRPPPELAAHRTRDDAIGARPREPHPTRRLLAILTVATID
jgi:hypothetical protein